MTKKTARMIPTIAMILHGLSAIHESQLLNDLAVVTTSEVNERGRSSLEGEISVVTVGMIIG
jgi:hypothetical protein